MKIFNIHAKPINNQIDEEDKIMVTNIIKQVIGA
jgi:hypothetical protein